MEFLSKSLDDNERFASWFAETYQNPSVVLLTGEMGAGKTTLMKALCKKLGAKDEVSSPTFSLVNEYKTASGKIYHFDLYRLKKASELPDMGFEEYLDSGQWCFIEWPQIAEPLLPKNAISLTIEVEEDIRKISVVQD
jgi:tRNA threonylcarbamoyladenosine biosynthesis protein TsaE